MPNGLRIVQKNELENLFTKLLAPHTFTCASGQYQITAGEFATFCSIEPLTVGRILGETIARVVLTRAWILHVITLPARFQSFFKTLVVCAYDDKIPELHYKRNCAIITRAMQVALETPGASLPQTTDAIVQILDALAPHLTVAVRHPCDIICHLLARTSAFQSKPIAKSIAWFRLLILEVVRAATERSSAGNECGWDALREAIARNPSILGSLGQLDQGSQLDAETNDALTAFLCEMPRKKRRVSPSRVIDVPTHKFDYLEELQWV